MSGVKDVKFGREGLGWGSGGEATKIEELSLIVRTTNNDYALVNGRVSPVDLVSRPTAVTKEDPPGREDKRGEVLTVKRSRR